MSLFLTRPPWNSDTDQVNSSPRLTISRIDAHKNSHNHTALNYSHLFRRQTPVVVIVTRRLAMLCRRRKTIVAEFFGRDYYDDGQLSHFRPLLDGTSRIRTAKKLGKRSWMIDRRDGRNAVNFNRVPGDLPSLMRVVSLI